MSAWQTGGGVDRERYDFRTVILFVILHELGHTFFSVFCIALLTGKSAQAAGQPDEGGLPLAFELEVLVTSGSLPEGLLMVVVHSESLTGGSELQWLRAYRSTANEPTAGAAPLSSADVVVLWTFVKGHVLDMPENKELAYKSSGDKELEIDLRYYDSGILRRKKVLILNFPYPYRAPTESGWLGSAQELVQRVAKLAAAAPSVNDRNHIAMKIMEAWGRAEVPRIRSMIAAVMKLRGFDFILPLYDESSDVRGAYISSFISQEVCVPVFELLVGAADRNDGVRHTALMQLTECVRCVWKMNTTALEKILLDTIRASGLEECWLFGMHGLKTKCPSGKDFAREELDCLRRGCKPDCAEARSGQGQDE